MKYIEAANLKDNAVIIDVLSEQSYKREHIKGAENFSIYEVAFSDKIESFFPDKNTCLYIYGLSNETEEASRAYATLKNLGYENVLIIDGGLKSWKHLSLPVIKGEENSEFDGKYILSTTDSILEWVGRNTGNKHTGDIKFKEGYLLLNKGILADGELIIDMKTIDNFDIKDISIKNMLINHLISQDFFEVEKFQTSLVKILKFEKTNDIVSKPNYKITAALTIKGITKNIEFLAHIQEKGENLVINTHFDINRTDWNVKYGSGKFFGGLGGHIIDDMISIDIIAHLGK